MPGIIQNISPYDVLYYYVFYNMYSYYFQSAMYLIFIYFQGHIQSMTEYATLYKYIENK